MIIIPAILESFRSLKDKTFKVVFESSEMTPEQMSGLAQNLNLFGYLAFKETPFKDKETEFLDSLKPEYDDTGKTKSQRLRGVIYRNWEQDPKGYEDHTRHYDFEMEKIITHYKNKLD